MYRKKKKNKNTKPAAIRNVKVYFSLLATRFLFFPFFVSELMNCLGNDLVMLQTAKKGVENMWDNSGLTVRLQNRVINIFDHFTSSLYEKDLRLREFC